MTTVLAPSLVTQWRRAVLAEARLKGMSRSEPEAARFAKVLKQERGAVLDLWRTYTQERGELRRQLLSGKREAVAYLLGFHLANAARTTLLLDRLAMRLNLAALLGDGDVTVNDLGCGTGAMTHAVWERAAALSIDRARLSFELFDASGTLLDAARTVFEDAIPEAQRRTHRIALEALTPSKFSPKDPDSTVINLLGYVWNETAKNPRARQRLKSIFHGHVERGERALTLLIEPATEAMARGAMELRDDLLELGMIPIYPCPHAKKCPMRERPKDWCYSEGAWKRPREAEDVDKILEVDRSEIAGTLMAFATPKLMAGKTLNAPSRVVVGRPTEAGADQRFNKHIFDYLLCQEDGTLGRATPKPGETRKPALRGMGFHGGE